MIGFAPVDKTLAVALAVISVQRDYGNRVDRAHARFKYTIDDKGLDWVKAEIETRLGFALEAPRPVLHFTSNGDTFGWATGTDGRHHVTLFVENGRIFNQADRPLMDGLREIARIHRGSFRLTPNQNLVIADIAPKARLKIETLLERYGLDLNRQSGLRLNSIACVALPTCALAMAESERYLPTLVTKIEAILARNGLVNEPITIRMSGCPNGCARPYVAEIGLTGRAPGKYNLYFGAGFHGQRLNKLYLENAGENAILQAIGELIAHYARDRREGERFGDFTIRTGYVKEVKSGREFNK